MKKWKGCDKETAQEKWNQYVRDPNIRRMNDVDGSLLLAAPVTATMFFNQGTNVSNKRSMAEARELHVGDVEAIIDERDSCLHGTDSVLCCFTVPFASVSFTLPIALPKPLRLDEVNTGRGGGYGYRRVCVCVCIHCSGGN